MVTITLQKVYAHRQGLKENKKKQKVENVARPSGVFFPFFICK